jgi:hypothetical protein
LTSLLSITRPHVRRRRGREIPPEKDGGGVCEHAPVSSFRVLLVTVPGTQMEAVVPRHGPMVPGPFLTGDESPLGVNRTGETPKVPSCIDEICQTLHGLSSSIHRLRGDMSSVFPLAVQLQSWIHKKELISLQVQLP